MRADPSERLLDAPKPAAFAEPAYGARLPQDAKVLSEGDWFDLVPGLCVQPSEGQCNNNNCHAVVIEGVLDEARLRSAVDALQARHPRMRAKYFELPKCRQNYLLETDRKIPLYIRDGGDPHSVNLDLERELKNSIDFANGPLCWVSYVRHPASTGLLIFGGSHAVGDGRACETALSHLLKLYDGQDVPFFSNTGSLVLMKLQENSKQADALVGSKKLVQWRNLQRKHLAVQEERTLREGFITETFVTPPHPAYRAHFDGVCIEIARLSKDEASRLLQACRAAGTTVTGAVVAAYKHACIKQMAARGRATESVTMGIDMNYRRYMEPLFENEMGNFLFDMKVYLPVSDDFWKTARGVRDFIAEALEEEVAFEGSIINMGGASREKFLMMRQASPALQGMFFGEEHGNVSSLGMLTKYGAYKDFKVLENITAAHVMFIGVKINCCSSGSSGALTVSVIVTKNIVDRPRELAKALRSDMEQLLRNLPPLAGAEVPGQSPSTSEITAAVESMQPLITRNRERAERNSRSVTGEVFPGDCSGTHSCGTHLRIVLNMICSTMCAGPLNGFPLYLPVLVKAGVFNFACAPGVESCTEQAGLLSTAYSISLSACLTLGVAMGYVYDLLGARRSSSLAAAVACICYIIIAMAVSMDGRSWPTLQVLCFCIPLALAELSGILASQGILGWMWHYPRQQAILMGFSNMTYQASACMVYVFQAVLASGLTLQDCFCFLALCCGLASVGLRFTSPSKSEYCREAGRVLAIIPDAVDSSSIIGCLHFRDTMHDVWRVGKLFPVQNLCFVTFVASMFAGAIYFQGNFEELYTVTYTSSEALALGHFWVKTFTVGALILNPTCGFCIDLFGFRCVAAVTALDAILLSAGAWVQQVEVQKVFILSECYFFGTIQTLIMKWPVYFAPAHLWGTFYGMVISICGSWSLISNIALGAVQQWDPEQCMLPLQGIDTFTAILALAFLVILYSSRYGLPRKPPKSRYG